MPASTDVRLSEHSNKYSICMLLRYGYRLYPLPGHQRSLARVFGCARVVFNDALAARRDAYEAGLSYPTDAELSARLTASKAAGTSFLHSRASGRAARSGRLGSGPARTGDKPSGSPRNAPFIITPGGKLRLPKIGEVPAGRRSPRCWSTKPAGAAGSSAGPAGSSPTSQGCSACRARDGPKPLSVRAWTCAACGPVHDRDVNAARNVLALGRRESLNARGGQVRPAPVLAPAREAGSRRGAA